MITYRPKKSNNIKKIVVSGKDAHEISLKLMFV